MKKTWQELTDDQRVAVLWKLRGLLGRPEPADEVLEAAADALEALEEAKRA
jgi:hypothetical protein